VQVPHSLEQRIGQRPESRANFYDVVAASGADRRDQPRDDVSIDEEVLAKPFPWNVPARRHGHLGKL
jgi:hypothetical protein